METTNGIYNMSLYKYLTTESVLSWVRSLVANRMSPDAKTWVNIFSMYNSGTYNNQWMVVDYNRYTPGSTPKSGTLWVLEQIPDLIESADVTDVLISQGYWPSYNIPYFPIIYNLSGFGAYEEQFGAYFTYDGNPRALIFKRDQGTVDSMDSMKFMIRYNDWQYDPLSQGNAGNAVASRFDLVVGNPPSYLTKGPYGAIDAKITSAKDIHQLKSTGISGPTFYEQPSFQWSSEWSSVPHIGMPYNFNFDWETFQFDK